MQYRNIFTLTALLFLAPLLSCSTPESTSPVSAAGNSTRGADTLKSQYNNIILPEGFVIHDYADVPGARSMCLSPSGVLYIGTREDKVYAVKDTNQDGRADVLYTVASGLKSPNGVAFKEGDLYIATYSTIYVIKDIESSLTAPTAPRIVYDKYPTDRHHGWKFIAFGPDGKLYVPVGAPCNICNKENINPVYASLTRLNTDGSGFEIIARGIRNTVGFTWHPETGILYFTDNGRDLMGDDIPTDELNAITATNQHFGYPFCHQGDLPDPEFGKGKSCSDYTPPVQKLGPHVAALGPQFYTGKMFPEKYKNRLFIAEHGSWNRSTPIGYRITEVTLDTKGKSLGYKVFAEGWLKQNGTVTGRPVDLELLPDGSMLVSDDYAGKIYRITYHHP